MTAIKIRKFFTYAPSEASIYPLELELRKNDERRDAKTGAVERVRIEGNPPNQATGMAWIILLLPTFVILGFIYLMMRRARG